MKWLTLLLVFVIAAPVMAQVDAEKAKAHYDEMMASLKAEETAASAARKAVQATEEFKTVLAAYRKDRKPADMKKLRAMIDGVPAPDMEAWRSKFAMASKKIGNAGGEAQTPFLCWLAMRGGASHGPDAIKNLTANHAASPALGELLDAAPRLGRTLGRSEVRAFATAVIDANASMDLKANAYYARAMNYGVAEGRKTILNDEEESKKAADEAAVVKLAPESIPALRINAPKFVEERLQVGMTVPDVIGEDMDGVGFKLSDYRGKVVVLDFWGDW